MAISYLGSTNFGGRNIISSPWDSVVMIVVALIFYFWGYRAGVGYQGQGVFDEEIVS